MSVLNDLLHGITPRMRKEMEQARKAELKRKAELRKQEQRITIENSAVSKCIIEEILSYLKGKDEIIYSSIGTSSTRFVPREDKIRNQGVYVFVSSRRVIVDTRDNWETIGILCGLDSFTPDADYEFNYNTKGYRMLEEYEPRILCEWIQENLKHSLSPSYMYSEIEGIHYTKRRPPEYFYRFKIFESIITECSNSSRLASW